MNDNQLTIIVYAILIFIVVPGLFGLVYIENKDSLSIDEPKSLEYISVEKETPSKVAITNNIQPDPKFSITLATVHPKNHRLPEIYTLTGVQAGTIEASLRADMPSTVTVYSLTPLRKPSFEKKSYTMHGKPLSERIDTETDPFVMTVDTRITDGGYTENDEFVIQTGSDDYSYDYSVYWNDKERHNLTEDTTIEFETPGVHQVAITGDMPHLQYERLYVEQGLGLKITAINQWGDIKWKSFEKSFRNTPNMRGKYTDTPNLESVQSMDRMFEGATQFNGSVNEWDTSNVTSMRATFSHAKSFDRPINKWDTSNVTSMYSMFRQANSFNQNIDNWNTSRVTNMDAMFLEATAFNKDISSLCVSQISTEPDYFTSESNIENEGSKHPEWSEPC